MRFLTVSCCHKLLLRGFASEGRKVQDVYIVSCARTPLGAMGGSLKGVNAVKLGQTAIASCVEKAGVSPEVVEEVFMGCVLQAGLGQAPARQAALGAGLTVNTPATTINKVCASGMKSISFASSSLSLGQRNLMVAGGMESLSNTPFTLKRGDTPYGGVKLTDSCHYDGLTDAYTGWHMGKCAENIAVKLGIGREEQDDYGLASYKKAKEAQDNGVFDKEVVSVSFKQGKKELIVNTDEEIDRCDLSTFRTTPCFWGDTVGVGSSSKLADGAAATLLVNDAGLAQYNLTPLARVVDYGDAAVEPVHWPVAPAKGAQELLERNGLSVQDISLWEINEAFALVVLANCQILGVDIEKVNIHGGAISLGHPLGMSGARITNHLALNLEKGQLGLATLCNGGGGAGSILIERL